MLILGMVFSTQLSHFYSITWILPLAGISMCLLMTCNNYEYIVSHRPSTPVGWRVPYVTYISHGHLSRKGTIRNVLASPTLTRAAVDPTGYELCHKVTMFFKKCYLSTDPSADRVSQLPPAMLSSSRQGFWRLYYLQDGNFYGCSSTSNRRSKATRGKSFKAYKKDSTAR